MFEPDSTKFTSKPDPKKEFIQYLKETGASAALQKAMILLYKMPVKPHNLAEYFSEYFQNGAQRLMRVSLLQAELCYKRDELEINLMKEEEMENRIKELIETLGITESEFEERFMPQKIKMQNRLSLLERYFKDIETGRRHTGDFSVPQTSAVPSIQGTTITPTTIFSVDNPDYDPENECLKNVRSAQAMLEDIKEIDPWGIICKATKDAEMGKRHDGRRGDRHSSVVNEEHLVHLHPQHPHHPPHSKHKRPDSGSMDSQAQEDEYEADDDDVTLAEVFHQAAYDSMEHDQDDVTAKLHNRLLMVRKANKSNMADFLGWSPLQSRQNIRTRGSTETAQTADGTSMNNEDTEMDIMEDDKTDVESLRRRPCEQNMLLDPQKESPKEDQLPDTDGFLFDDDEDLEVVYKMLEAETAQGHFDYEFFQHSRKVSVKDPEVCVPQCDVSDTAIMCATQKEKPKLVEKECPHCAAGKCDCNQTSDPNQSFGFLPGKMINWTHQYDEYPCSSETEYSDFPMTGEETEIFRKQRAKSSAKCRIRTEPEPSDKPQIPLTRVDSSCHCLMGAYSAGEILGESDYIVDNGRYFRKISLEPPSDETIYPPPEEERRYSNSNQVDASTATEETLLDNELEEVFKQKARKSSARRNSMKSESEKQVPLTEEDEVNSTIQSDVFGVDLPTEVRRTLLGFTPSELVQAKDAGHVHETNEDQKVETPPASPAKPKRRSLKRATSNKPK